jgi:hypothetical protein
MKSQIQFTVKKAIFLWLAFGLIIQSTAQARNVLFAPLSSGIPSEDGTSPCICAIALVKAKIIPYSRLKSHLSSIAQTDISLRVSRQRNHQNNLEQVDDVENGATLLSDRIFEVSSRKGAVVLFVPFSHRLIVESP